MKPIKKVPLIGAGCTFCRKIWISFYKETIENFFDKSNVPFFLLLLPLKIKDYGTNIKCGLQPDFAPY